MANSEIADRATSYNTGDPGYRIQASYHAYLGTASRPYDDDLGTIPPPQANALPLYPRHTNPACSCDIFGDSAEAIWFGTMPASS